MCVWQHLLSGIVRGAIKSTWHIVLAQEMLKKFGVLEMPQHLFVLLLHCYLYLCVFLREYESLGPNGFNSCWILSHLGSFKKLRVPSPIPVTMTQNLLGRGWGIDIILWLLGDWDWSIKVSSQLSYKGGKFYLWFPSWVPLLPFSQCTSLLHLAVLSKGCCPGNQEV